jgi:hypothetical protein
LILLLSCTVLCAIKYFLSCNNSTSDILEWNSERGWKAKKLKEKGKTNNQVEKKRKKLKSFKDINRERQGTNQP